MPNLRITPNTHTFPKSVCATRPYEPETLASLVTDAGFSQVKIITDFSAREGDGDYGCMNHRMIVTAKKL